MQAGCCLVSEGNGVSLGEGGEGGPGPQETGKISSQYPAEAVTTWARTRKTNQARRDGGGKART